MIKLSDLTKDYKAGTQKSRKELVKMFVERLNNDRKFAKLKEMEARYYAIKLSPVKTHELESLYREWDRTGNFSKAFWSRIK
jgi:hypothetical protein